MKTNQASHFLSQKKFAWIFILIAVIPKSIFTALFSSYEGDKSFYLLLAKSLGSGHGFNIPVTLLSNPAETGYLYLPSAVSPLYSILVTPLLKIFPGNYFLVTWLIETFSWLLLFIVLHRILAMVLKEYLWPNLFVLFAGFFLYNLELTSSSKDILATALLFCGLLRCIHLYQSSSQKSLPYLLVSSLLFILPGLTKYTFIPLAAAFPMTLLVVYFFNKEKKLLRPGLICLFVSIGLIIGHYLFFHWLDLQSMHHLEAFYFNRWSLAKNGNEFVKGFYPSNLLLLYPYIPAAVFNLDIIGTQIRAHVRSLYHPYAIFLTAVNFSGIIFQVSFIIYVLKNKFQKALGSRLFFFVSGSIISLSILLLTSIWSLRYQAIEYKGGVSSWTYVFENRPYFFSILFIQLLFVVFLFSKKFSSAFMKFFRNLVLIVMLVGAIHGFYFMTKTLVKPPTASHSINKLVVEATDSIQKANPGYSVMLATEIQHLDWYAKLNNQKVLNYVYFLNDSSFALPAKTILITAVNKDDVERIDSYLRKNKDVLTKNIDNNWFLYLQKKD